MLVTLNKIHRFFLSQSLYPIILSSLLAMMIFIGRVVINGNSIIYRNLVWNLFLAWLPYIFSMVAAAAHLLYPRRWWLLLIPAALWLLFFPNAPYLVTDFLHLQERPPLPLWYDILLLTSFALCGFFLAVASLRTMHELVKAFLGWFVGWLFVAVALSLSGLGIYLGRFERWNSWDLFFHPRTILNDVLSRMLNPMDNLRFVGFTLLVTALLLVTYLMFISARPYHEPELKSPELNAPKQQ